MKKITIMLFIIISMVVTVNAQSSVTDSTSIKLQTKQKRSLSFARAIYLVEKMMQKPDSISWLTYEDVGDNLGGIYISKNHEATFMLDTAVFQQKMVILCNLPSFINSISVNQIIIVSYPVSLSGDQNRVMSEEFYRDFIKRHPVYR